MIWKAWRQETIPTLGLVVALVGLFSGHTAILAVGAFFWGLAFLSSFLARRTLTRIQVNSRMQDRQAEIGEVVVTEMVVKNPLPWPILDVQWKIDLPQTVDPSGPGTALLVPGGTRQTLTGTLWVGARQRVRIQYSLAGRERGRWNIGPGSLTFRDPLSWNELIREDRDLAYLTVWPQRLPVPQNFWSATFEMGKTKGKPWDPPDPLAVAAIRPYQPGDPVRHVAAHASARMARIMVRQLEPVKERSVEILLHPKTTDAHWHGLDRPLLEDVISVAASLAESSVRLGLATGLSGSGSIPGHIRGFTLPAERRTSPDELLTALAWLQPSGTMDDDLPHVLARLERRLTRTTTLVVVSPYWSDEWEDQLIGRVRHGLRIISVTLGDIHPKIPNWVRERWHYDDRGWQHA